MITTTVKPPLEMVPLTENDKESLRALMALDAKGAIHDAILQSIVESVRQKRTISTKQLYAVTAIINKSYTEYLKYMPTQGYRVEDIEVYKSTDYYDNRKERPQIKTVEVRSDLLKLNFFYDPVMIERVKRIKGRKWNAQGKYWTVPFNSEVVHSLKELGFVLPVDIEMYQGNTYTGELDLSQFKKLRPYQKAGIRLIAGKFNLRALLADEMGCGKTIQALASLYIRREDAFPVLIVCPATLKWNWAKEINTWLPKLKPTVLEGRPKIDSIKLNKEDIYIINYDILADMEKGASAIKGWEQLLMTAGFKSIVVDECHKIKNRTSKRSIAVKKLSKKIPFMIGISGTPIENKPAEFYPILSMLSPLLFPNWWQFSARYCGGHRTPFGWEANGATHLEELNRILTHNLMIRRLKKDVLKELPPKQKVVIPIEIDMAEYNKEMKVFDKYLDKVQSGTNNYNRMEGIALIEKAKQAAVKGKLQYAFNWIEDYLETGKKLVIFAYHVFVLDELEKRFPNITVRVDGSVTGIARMTAVQEFQNNPVISLLIGNIKAAGVGLTLTAASDTLTLELGWNPSEHDQAEDRVNRIGQTASSITAYYLIAKNTIEEQIIEGIDTKRKVVTQILDNEEVMQENLFQYLLNYYKPRGK